MDTMQEMCEETDETHAAPSVVAPTDSLHVAPHVPAKRRIALQVAIQAMPVLMDVLTTVSRVGGQFETVAAESRQVRLVVVAGERVANRLPRLIDQLIGVIHVSEQSAGTL